MIPTIEAGKSFNLRVGNTTYSAVLIHVEPQKILLSQIITGESLYGFRFKMEAVSNGIPAAQPAHPAKFQVEILEPFDQ